MSERVSDDDVRAYSRGHWDRGSTRVARELLSWRALGESPESVRAELERLRADPGRFSESKDAPTPRPTPLEALEEAVDAVLGPYVAPSAVKVGELRDIVRRARRAAGEVL